EHLLHLVFRHALALREPLDEALAQLVRLDRVQQEGQEDDVHGFASLRRPLLGGLAEVDLTDPAPRAHDIRNYLYVHKEGRSCFPDSAPPMHERIEGRGARIPYPT